MCKFRILDWHQRASFVAIIWFDLILDPFKSGILEVHLLFKYCTFCQIQDLISQVINMQVEKDISHTQKYRSLSLPVTVRSQYPQAGYLTESLVTKTGNNCWRLIHWDTPLQRLRWKPLAGAKPQRKLDATSWQVWWAALQSWHSGNKQRPWQLNGADLTCSFT